MNWSQEQDAIFAAVAGPAHLVTVARAGTGKTTTFVEAAARAIQHKRVLYGAYNKSIQEELAVRLKRGEALTFHALGRRILQRAKWNVMLDNKRGLAKIERAAADLGVPLPRNGKWRLAEVMDTVKESRPFATVADAVAAVEEEGLDTELIIPADKLAGVILRAMELSRLKDGSISFSDMVWLPVVEQMVKPEYDFVIVDEAQDMSRAQIAIAAGAAARLAVVGDPRQAIYGFRGADTGSMGRLATQLGATTLGLKTTYRCAKRIVREANKLVPDLRARDDAPEGEVVEVEYQAMMAAVRPGDFVLSRTNAPLIRVCLRLLKQGVPATITGSDIGSSLASLIKSWGRQLSSGQVVSRAIEWGASQLRRLEPADTRGRERVNDKVSAVKALAQGLEDSEAIIARIEGLFSKSNDSEVVTCSSVHKAKGRERDCVWMLVDSFRDDSEEERNIRYVAITRAKTKLALVTGGVKTADSGER